MRGQTGSGTHGKNTARTDSNVANAEQASGKLAHADTHAGADAENVISTSDEDDALFGTDVSSVPASQSFRENGAPEHHGHDDAETSCDGSDDVLDGWVGELGSTMVPEEMRIGNRVVGHVDDLVDGEAVSDEKALDSSDGDTGESTNEAPNGGREEDAHIASQADPFQGKWVDGRDIMAKIVGDDAAGAGDRDNDGHERKNPAVVAQDVVSHDDGNGADSNAYISHDISVSVRGNATRKSAAQAAANGTPGHLCKEDDTEESEKAATGDGIPTDDADTGIHAPLPVWTRGRSGKERKEGTIRYAHEPSWGDPRTLRVVLSVLAIIAIAVVLVANPPIYSVTVNGTSRLVLSGTTVKGIAESLSPAPKPGRLLAVDGSVLDEGGGDAFEAKTGDGTTLEDGSTLAPGSSVEISDGNDVTEAYDKVTETIPHGEADSAKVDSASHYYDGSVHVYHAGTDGERETRTGKVSGKVATVTTKEPVDSSYEVLSPDTHGEKVIALTFDDGPNPTYTPQVLDILKENDAKATFMEVGSLVSENGDLVRRVRDEGHEIGTHTWDHAAGSGHGVDLTRMSADEHVSEVDRGFQAINDALGEGVPKVMRAPGGNYHGDVIRNLAGHADVEVGWNVDTRDWARPGVDAIVSRITSAKPGSIVLMHDGGGNREQTVEALRQAIPQLKAEGYRFVTVSEMLKDYCGIDIGSMGK